MFVSMYFRSLYFFHIFVSTRLLHAYLLFLVLVTLKYLVKGFESSGKKTPLHLGDEIWEGWCGSGFYLGEEDLKFQKYFPYFKPY